MKIIEDIEGKRKIIKEVVMRGGVGASVVFKELRFYLS